MDEHLQAITKAAHEGNAEAVHGHLMDAVQAAHMGGMHGAAADLSEHLADLHAAHAHDSEFGTGLTEAEDEDAPYFIGGSTIRQDRIADRNEE
jgi:hypothetical protein